MQRSTRQRHIIREVFARERRPLTPVEVRLVAAESLPSVGLATVYRAIRDLMAEGWLRTVDIPGDAPRYELADLPHHHHFLCRACGRVFDLPSCPAGIRNMAPSGFVVESHELTLRGLCSSCHA